MALWYKNIKNNDIFTTDTPSRVPRASKNLENLVLQDSAQVEKKNQKKGFFVNFCSILTVFHSFFNSGWILALQLTRVDFNLVVQIFWHPWGHINIGVKEILAI